MILDIETQSASDIGVDLLDIAPIIAAVESRLFVGDKRIGRKVGISIGQVGRVSQVCQIAVIAVLQQLQVDIDILLLKPAEPRTIIHRVSLDLVLVRFGYREKTDTAQEGELPGFSIKKLDTIGCTAEIEIVIFIVKKWHEVADTAILNNGIIIGDGVDPAYDTGPPGLIIVFVSCHCHKAQKHPYHNFFHTFFFLLRCCFV